MALQLSYTDRFGTVHAAAYARIGAVHLDLNAGIVAVNVQIWGSETARNTGKEKFISEGVQLTLAPNELTANPSAAAYTDLKTLGRYTTATDV